MYCQEYFLGGSSPNGFSTHFGEIMSDPGFYACIIKGGPGTGKSSLMKRLADAFPDEEKELYHCSSDPASLDAVIFSGRRVVLVDGTAPHAFEPEYPGAVQQILDLGACWDASFLRKNKDEIIAVTDECQRRHASCRRYITALAAVADDTRHIGALALNEDKLDGFAARLAVKVLPKKRGADPGRISFRNISAVTPDGYLTYPPKGYSVYLLNDSFYAGSDVFLRRFADIAASRGYSVSVSVCTLHGSETFEHLLIPELDLAFMTATPLNGLELTEKQPVNFRRFYDKSVLCEKKERLRFNRTAAADLLAEAVNSLKSAKAEHDRLEEFYIDAVDFDSVNRVYYSMVSRIKSL